MKQAHAVSRAWQAATFRPLWGEWPADSRSPARGAQARLVALRIRACGAPDESTGLLRVGAMSQRRRELGVQRRWP